MNMYNILRAILEIPLYFISGIFIRNKNRIILGAWNGEKYSDNSKYMMNYISQIDKFELIWIGKKKLKNNIPIKSNIKFVEYNSLKSYYYLLTSKYIFITHSYTDVSKFNVLKGAKVIQLWHGIGIKKIGSNTISHIRFFDKIRFKLQSIIRNYDYFICSSKLNQKRNLIAFKYYGANEDNIIESGQPRNDILFKFNQNDIDNVKEKYFKEYNIPQNKKIITYLPTFRINQQEQFSFWDLNHKNMERLKHILETNNIIILEKSHQHSIDITNKKQSNNYIYNISSISDIDTQELLLVTDILITDYSSVYMDYLLLDREIIHYVYDYEKYTTSDQGLYYDIYDISGGQIVDDIDKLLNAIEKSIKNSKYSKTTRLLTKEKMMEYEKGNSCKIICEKIGIIR